MEFFTVLVWVCTGCVAGAAQTPGAAGSEPLDPTGQTGPLQFTGVITDLAINGEGLFVLRDAATEEKFLTRTGDFRIDAGSYLVSIHGFRVQGFNSPIRFDSSYRDGDPIGDLRLDKGIVPPGLPASAANAGVLNVIFGPDGRILILLTDGTAFIRGQVLLQSAQKPQALVTRWLFLSQVAKSADSLVRHGRPGDGIHGSLLSGALTADSPTMRGIAGPAPLVLLDRIRGETEVWVVGAQEMTVVQASTDFVHWLPIRTNRYGSDSIRFTDTSPKEAGVRFYRAVSPFVRQTGIATDLGISGQGYFVLRDPTTGVLVATRAGRFQMSSQGHLISPQGLRLQGYNAPREVSLEYSQTSPIGDIRLDKGTLPPGLAKSAGSAGISNISIDSGGRLQVLLSNGTQYVRGQILLQKFSNPFALVSAGNNLYTGIEAAGPLPRLGRPQTQELGRINSGALEFSAEIKW